MHRLVPDDAYNVFSRKQQPALRCAVRQDRPVPSFVQGETWEFKGTVKAEKAQSGFHPEAASHAMRLSGYYLFHALQA